MSLLEGFSDYVMDEVGKDLVPGVERISAQVPRAAPRPAVAVRAGGHAPDRDGRQARAVRARARRSCRRSPPPAGRPRCNRLWAGPEMLPRHGEIDDPARVDRAGRSSVDGRRGARDRRRVRRTAGPGSGPGGAPTAIALSPILSARYRSRDLERIRAAAPGRPDRDAVARGPDRRAGRRRRGPPPRLARRRTRSTGCWRARRGSNWVHSASAGVERALTPAARERGIVDHERARRVLAADRRVRPDDDPGGQPPAAGPARAPARADVAAARGRRAARRHGRDRRARLDRAGGRRAGDGVRLPGRRGPAAVGGRRRGRSAAGRRHALVRRGRCSTGSAVRSRCRSCSPSPTSSCSPRRSRPRPRT